MNRKLYFALCDGEPIVNSFNERAFYQKIIDFIIAIWGEVDFDQALEEWGLVGETDLINFLQEGSAEAKIFLENYDIYPYFMYLEEV